MSERTAEHIIREVSTLKMGESLYSNYPNGVAAFSELVDNAVDNRIDGQPLKIIIALDKTRLYVYNEGGTGLDLKGLENFLNWGHSEKTDRDIGQYGVGGKAAMGFLGNGIVVRCSPQGPGQEYRLEDLNWGNKPEGTEQQHRVSEKPKVHTEGGFFAVEITDLKPGRVVLPQQLEAHLASTYKLLLESGAVSIRIGNKEVKPLEIPYQTDNDLCQPELDNRYQTGFGDWVKVSLGILKPGSKDLKPGLRLYYHGRLVQDGVYLRFPKPAQLPQSSRLIGEVELNSLKVTTNKSAFIEDDHYQEAVKAVMKALHPWEARLRSLAVESTNQPERYEQELAAAARRVFQKLNSQFGLLDLTQLSTLIDTRFPLADPAGLDKAASGRQRFLGPLAGSTPPSRQGSEGSFMTKREPVSDWQVAALGDETLRSGSFEEAGKQYIKVNADFPPYQVARGEGQVPLERYIIETAVAEVGKAVFKDRSVADFVDWYNRVLQLVGTHYQTRSRR